MAGIKKILLVPDLLAWFLVKMATSDRQQGRAEFV